MGMYDDIETPKIACPVCGKILTGFQSKDGDCSLSALQFYQVNNFYTSCKNCETWVEFNRKIPPKSPLSDYEMSMNVYTKRHPHGLVVN